MSEENKAIVRSFFEELWNTGNLEMIDDLMHAKCDGDLFYPVPGTFPPSAKEAFSAAKSPSYGEGGVTTRLEEMTKAYPDLAKLIIKGLIIRQEGNFRGVIKTRAKKYRNIERLSQTCGAQLERWSLKKTWSGRDEHFKARFKVIALELRMP